jgi:hypothetical protein
LLSLRLVLSDEFSVRPETSEVIDIKDDIAPARRIAGVELERVLEWAFDSGFADHPTSVQSPWPRIVAANGLTVLGADAARPDTLGVLLNEREGLCHDRGEVAVGV